MVKRHRHKDRKRDHDSGPWGDRDDDDRRRRSRRRNKKKNRRRRERNQSPEALGAVTTGRQTLASIEQAIQDLRQREGEMQGEIERLTATRADEVTKRLQAYRELAEVRARDAVADGVIDEADRLSSRVADLLSARQRTIDELRERQDSADRRRRVAIASREQLISHIDDLEQQLDDLALRAREELSSDPAYIAAIKAREEQTSIHDKADNKADRAQADRDTKGRAYEEDPLFMYLWRREYGQSTYKATGFVRWLDGWVARLVGYNEARANYTVLNEIPVRLDEHVDHLANMLNEKREAVEALETEKIRELADGDMTVQLRARREQEDQASKDIAEVTAELSDLGEQLNKYAEGHDPAFAKAIEMSTEFLGQHTTERLLDDAYRTPSPTDDEITARISNLDQRIAKLSTEHDRKTTELEKIFERRDELLRIAADFRRNHYDDSASEFRGEDLAGAILGELVRGAITGAEYWARTRRRQSRRSRPADSFRRSQKFPPFDLDDMFDMDDIFDFDDDDFWTEGKF